MASHSAWGDTQEALALRWAAARDGSSSHGGDLQTTAVEVEWRTHQDRRFPFGSSGPLGLLALTISAIDLVRRRSPGVAVTVRNREGKRIAHFRLSAGLSPLHEPGRRPATLVRSTDAPDHFILDVDGNLVSPLPGVTRRPSG